MAKSLTPEQTERRAKKQARREKQRQANAGRAAKMHEARLASDLPTSRGLDEKQTLFIGCSGWFYWDWRGRFYPEDLPTNQWFAHYAKHFNTVELNAPFYSWPTVATVKTWLRQAGRKQFTYTVKASELITHVKRFEGTEELVRDFGHIADLLGPRMGCFLFQLPPSYSYSPERLDDILRQLEPGRRNVVEFRHKTWWNDRVYKAFEKAGAIFCSCSGPRLPDELVKTSDEIYVRFHGVTRWYRYDYSKEELDVWAKRIAASNAKRAWIYFNNDFGGNAIKNARALRRMLKPRR
jgi:uncharacterized protein YecE (DUF72 family)